MTHLELYMGGVATGLLVAIVLAFWGKIKKAGNRLKNKKGGSDE